MRDKPLVSHRDWRSSRLVLLFLVILAVAAACTPPATSETPVATTAIGERTPPSKATAAPPGQPVATRSAVSGTVVATAVATVVRSAVATSATIPAATTGLANVPSIYSTNGQGLSQIDAQTFQVIGTISAGTEIRDVAISPDGRFAYLVTGSAKMTSLPGVGGTAGVATPGASAAATGIPGAGVVVYDLSTRTLLGQIAVGSDPWAIDLSRDGRAAYVTNRGDGTVSVIDTASRTITTTLTVGIQPTGLAISDFDLPAIVVPTPATKTAPTVTPTASGRTATATPGVVGTTTPTGGGTPTVTSTPAPARRITYLYVANYGSNDISVIDLANNRILSKITVGRNPIAVAADGANNRVFVANLGSSDLSVVDVRDNQVDSRVRLDGQPSSVAVSADGYHIYVTLIDPTNAVQIVNPALLSVAGTPLPIGTPAVAGSPVATSTAVGTTVARANTPGLSTSTPTATITPSAVPTQAVGATRIAVGGNPSDVLFDSQGFHAFVSSSLAGTVSVIDTAARTVIATIQVGGQPSGLGFMPGPTRSTPTRVTTATAVVTLTATSVPTSAPRPAGTGTPTR